MKKYSHCRNECRPLLERKECNKKANAVDNELEGSVKIGSQSIELKDIPDSKPKAYTCALNTFQTILQPKIEQCVRKILHMSGEFHLHQLSLDELLNTEMEYDAMEVAGKLYDLQRLYVLISLNLGFRTRRKVL